jgi:hypothetical protein
MTDWRYSAYRLNGDGTETLLDPDLPLQGAGLTRVVSGPQSIQAKITPAVARLVGPDGKPILTPRATAIYAEEGGTVHAAGIVTNIGRSGPELSITATGFSAFPRDEPYDGETFFVQTDPLDIYRHVWAWLQSRPRRNLGVTLGSDKVGVLIGTVLEQVEFDTAEGPVSFEAGPVKLNWWETDDLGQFLDNLAGENDFDYVERHQWVGEAVKHYIDFGIPRLGRRRDDLRFVVGENVTVKPTENFNDASYASEVIVRGAGEGRTMVRGFATRTGESRLGRTAVVEDKQIKSVLQANLRARRELAMRTGEAEITEIVVKDMRDDLYPGLGAWDEGDDIELHTEGEWGSTTAWYRVVSTTITPEDLSVAKLAVARADMIGA